MEYSLNSSTYIVEQDIPMVVLFTRDANFRKVVFKVPYFPYFYVREDEVRNLRDNLTEFNLTDRVYSIGGKYLADGGDIVSKVTCKIPNDVRMIRDLIEARKSKHTTEEFQMHGNWKRVRLRHQMYTYEADIIFSTRFLIDSGIKSGFTYDGAVPDTCIVEAKMSDLHPCDAMPRLKIGVVDIETYTRRISEMKTYSSPVIVVGMYNMSTSKLEQFTGNEVEILYKVAEYLKAENFDIIISYSLFDIDYLLHRMKIRGIDVKTISMMEMVNVKRGKIYGTDILDLSDAYKKAMGEPTWNTLDFVSRKELKEGKMELSKFNVPDTWDSDPEEVVRYNAKDVDLTVRLEQKLFLIREFLDPIRRVVGCNFEDVFMANRLGDIQYLRLNAGKLVLRSRSSGKYVISAYLGAIVKLIKTGIFENVLVLDWSEMYPSIIENLNIGWNTYDPCGEIKITEDSNFNKLEVSWTTIILRELRLMRRKIKDEIKATEDKDRKKILKMRSSALKSIINAAYGCYGFAGVGSKYKEKPARLYAPKIALAITIVGRMLLEEGISFLRSIYYDVIYGDTDSMFIQLKNGSKEEMETIKNKLVEHIINYAKKTWNLDNVSFSVDVDKVFTKLILLRKKRYHGKIDNGEEEVKGIEVVRKDVAEYTADLELEIGRMIIDGTSKAKIEERYLKAQNDVLKGRIPDEKMMIKAKCKKAEYDRQTAPWRAMKVGNTYFDQNIDPDERFYTVYIKGIRNDVGGVDCNGAVKTVDSRRNPVIVKIALDIVGFKNPEIPKTVVIDYSKMVERIVKKPLEKYINLKTSSETKTLSDYF